jgi:tetratricopeptide (TPR) repeat protein
MPMHRVPSFIATALLALGLFAAAARADDWPTCTAAKGDEAIAACSRLIESGQLDVSRLASVYSNRGVARRHRGDLNGAIADLDQAIRLNPKLGVAYNNRCLAYSGQKNYDRAIADCDQAIRLDPKLTVAYNNRCFARIGKGDLDGALADCDQAIRLDPKLATAFGNRCGARLAEGASDAALSDCNRAIELDPNYTGAYVNRGVLFEHSGDRPRAVSDFQMALARPPKYLTGKSFQDRAREHLAALGVGGEAGTSTSSPVVSSGPTPVVLNPSSRTEVPLKAVGGTFVVPVAINGAITLNFIIDSGAADVTVPSDVVGTLIRTGTIERSDFIGTQTYILADGSESPSNTFVIRSLKVGDALVENVKGSIAPAAGNLLLGQSFLQRFKSWSIDNTKHELVLEPR